MNVSIEKLTPNDLEKFIQVIQLFENVFEMKDFSIPDFDHLQKLLNRNDFFVFIAKDGNSVIGALTAYVLEQYYSAKPLAYIFDLAVDPKNQRQGIGKKLITTVNKYCAKNGFEEVFVQADKVDDYALDFYRSTKPSEEEQVVHFYYSLAERK